MQLKYTHYRVLSTRGPIESGPDIDVDGVLLVADDSPALVFTTRHSDLGHDRVEIYPAFHNGDQSWLRRCTWMPGFGYSASGTQESILPFEDGLRIFLERGVFALHVPSDVASAITAHPDDAAVILDDVCTRHAVGTRALGTGDRLIYSASGDDTAVGAAIAELRDRIPQPTYEKMRITARDPR
jgi:hypothetical protein